jgi:hypothetical protein
VYEEGIVIMALSVPLSCCRTCSREFNLKKLSAGDERYTDEDLHGHEAASIDLKKYCVSDVIDKSNIIPRSSTQKKLQSKVKLN